MNKICSKCGLEKDSIEFYKRKASYDGLAFKCKSCCKEFEKTTQGKLIRNRAVRRYQVTERGKIVAKKSNQKRTGTAKRRASSNRSNLIYKKTERGRFVQRAANLRRREWKAGLDSNFKKEDVSYVYSRFENKCFLCNKNIKLSIDHHRPLFRGYGLSIQNAVLLCVSCNSSKGTKLPERFYDVKQLEVLRGLGVI
jgi:5-methylcytosine-specific restriction endonuclease McrA